MAAPRDAVYQAFIDPELIVQWLAPEGMTGRIHAMDPRVGGGYDMSLYYNPDVQDVAGKTVDREDRFAARFLELDPPGRVVQGIRFDTTDPAFQGEMTMTVILADQNGGTEVRIVFEGIPPGIRPEDNEAGTASSLGALARLMQP